MPISHVLVLGAGPAGLSAALAITQLQSSPPIRVTVLELRPSTTTTVVGGSVNLTPLALRYLDRLGAGARVRALGTPVRSGVDFVSLRTGKVLGVLWKGVDGLRVMRSDVVASMREVAERSEGIDVRYGVRVVSVREEGDEGTGEVVVGLEGGEEMRGDILLGCDGLHSAARHLYVEPERKKEYSGRVVAMAFARVEVAGDVGLRRHGGQTAFADSAMLTGRYGAMVMSFYEPTREKMFMGAVMDMEQEHGGENERDGWKAKGADKARVKEEVIRRFGNTAVAGFAEMLEAQDDWTLWPVYLLPPGGRWSKGRVLLLGDAAHTMPPMGESIGTAVEDGALIAHVLTRHKERTVTQLFQDYETLRRAEINHLYAETTMRWKSVMKKDLGWLGSIILEWTTLAVLTWMSWTQKNKFGKDVAKLELPA